MLFTSLRQRIILIVNLVAFGGICYTFFTHKHSITIITSIKQAKSVFEHATPNDLFVFDIDFTILEPVDPVFQLKNTLPPAFNGSITPTQLALMPLFHDLFATLAAHDNVEKMYRSFKNGPAEQETLSYINDLRSRGVPVICLTARKGSEKMLTAHELHNLGLKLAASFPHTKPINFDNLDRFARGSVKSGDICYYSGILFAASVPKGIILSEFFKRTGYRPARVFFFDDHRKNSYSITKAMHTLGVPSYCFAYYAKRVRGDSSIDLAIVKKQFEYIKNKTRFIDYESAKLLH